MAELEETVTQYKLHVDHLEKVLRCIDNEAIQPDELEDLKNDFESYLVCAVQHSAKAGGGMQGRATRNGQGGPG